MFYPIFFTKIDRSIQNGKDAGRFLQLNYLLHLTAGCISILLLWIYDVNYPLQLSGIVYLNSNNCRCSILLKITNTEMEFV